MTKAGTAPRKKSEKQLLIEALIGTTRGCNWPLEMKMLGQLLKRIPDTQFWFHYAKAHKCNTLIHLLADFNNTNLILREFADYTKANTVVKKIEKQVELLPEKVGDDIIVEQQKPKTLRDFLNRI